MKKNKVLGGLMGLCVGDALGVPFESVSRSEMKKKPATGMSAYGVHLQPAGTWSDDSSLAFCLADSLCSGFNINDIAEKFVRWFEEGLWTPYGSAFGIGDTTLNSIIKLKHGISPSESGGFYESQNGNGSLMRILPLAYYVENLPVNEQFKTAHEVSAITHAHARSKMACGIYAQIAVELLRGRNPREAYESAKVTALKYYSHSPFSEELKHFSRMLEGDISELPEEEINSSGYVVDTLEASIWCLLKNTSYRETVLAAVNLGEDTDTTGAAAGGLAGIYYGFEGIPSEWVDTIARKDDITALASRLSKKIYGE